MRVVANNNNRSILFSHGYGHNIAVEALEKFRSRVSEPDDAYLAGVLGTGSLASSLLGQSGVGRAKLYVSSETDEVIKLLNGSGWETFSTTVSNIGFNDLFFDISQHDLVQSYLATGLPSRNQIEDRLKTVVLDLHYGGEGDTAIRASITVSEGAYGLVSPNDPVVIVEAMQPDGTIRGAVVSAENPEGLGTLTLGSNSEAFVDVPVQGGIHDDVYTLDCEAVEFGTYLFFIASDVDDAIISATFGDGQSGGTSLFTNGEIAEIEIALDEDTGDIVYTFTDTTF